MPFKFPRLSNPMYYGIIAVICTLIILISFFLRLQSLNAFAANGVEIAARHDQTLVPADCLRTHSYYEYTMTDLRLFAIAVCPDGDGFQEFRWNLKPETDI